MGNSWKKAAALLAALVAVSILPGPITSRATSSSELTNDSIRQKEDAIGEAQKMREALQSGLTDVQKMVDELESTKQDLNNYVTKLDANLNSIEEKLTELEALISEKEDEITKSEEALELAIQIEEEQYAAMKKRIQFMYERSKSLYLDMLFSSKNFGDFLNKADYIAKISAYDRKMLTEYEETRKQIEELKEELEADKIVLDAASEAAREERNALNTLISAKEQEIQVYEADISNKEQVIKQYEAEIAAQNATITALEQAVEEERKRLAAENAKVKTYDGGVFQWPAPSYTRISDDYGNRIHPTLGVQQFHNGVDMAAPSGSPILAAYDGTVVAAAYSGTMGNYIMIDHGDSLYTIYMHSSALYVSKGAEVTKGQKIAAVGSTGRSTGPHLHFSVRLNGSYVSPWSYLS